MSARSMVCLVTADAIAVDDRGVDVAKRFMEDKLLEAIDPERKRPATWVEASRLPWDERITWTEETRENGDVELTGTVEVDE